VCVRVSRGNKTVCLPKHHKPTLQGCTAAAGSLIPTAWEVNLPSRRRSEAAKQQVADCCRRSHETRVLRRGGPGAAQVRRAAAGGRGTAQPRALRAARGLRQSWLYVPLQSRTASRSSCTQRAPFTWLGGDGGGPGWGQHIRSPCPASPKELLVLPVLPVQRDYRNVSELQVSFLFPQKKTGRHSH